MIHTGWSELFRCSADNRWVWFRFGEHSGVVSPLLRCLLLTAQSAWWEGPPHPGELGTPLWRGKHRVTIQDWLNECLLLLQELKESQCPSVWMSGKLLIAQSSSFWLRLHWYSLLAFSLPITHLLSAQPISQVHFQLWSLLSLSFD